MRKLLLPAALAVALATTISLPGACASAAAAQAAVDDPALAAILAKADAASAAAPSAQAAAIEATAIAGDWQLATVDGADAPYLYVDSTLHFAADGTVTIQQKLKNRDRTDDWTATVPGAQDASGAWQFAPADETIPVRSYEDRPVAKTDLEDQITPWRFRYDDADRAGNQETHARTMHRSYAVTNLEKDTLTVALTYSDSDGCDPRTVTLTYTRGLHVVTDEDRAAQKKLDTPWKTSKEAAAEAEEKAKQQKAAEQKAKESAEQQAAESARPTGVQDPQHPTVEDVRSQAPDTGDIPDLRITL